MFHAKAISDYRRIKLAEWAIVRVSTLTELIT